MKKANFVVLFYVTLGGVRTLAPPEAEAARGEGRVTYRHAACLPVRPMAIDTRQATCLSYPNETKAR